MSALQGLSRGAGWWIPAVFLFAGLPGSPVTADGVSGSTSSDSWVATSRAVDALLSAAIPAEEFAPLTSDEDFLRRVTLDLAGRVPTPQEITRFGLTAGPDKRSATIERLLNSEDYARIWAAYWSEVVFSHATDARARIVQSGFEEWLEGEFRENRPWDEITRELLTATGKISEDGRTALIFAHTGDPAELAAETSRIFLGIQIQCANCHDHPTDSWKREQFHQLAAFFPRIQVRRDPGGAVRDFVVSSLDARTERRRDLDPARTFAFLDRNKDGKLDESEAERAPFLKERFGLLLQTVDGDNDGALSEAEFMKAPRPPMDQPGRGAGEYYMPDMSNPSSRGTLVQPVFFVDGAKIGSGADDLERRDALARAITSDDNAWFAKAFVNRMWGELLGEGFYMPIDDLGPQRTPQCPEVLDLLAGKFTEEGYDVRWLLRTIANTQAYQRQIRTRSPSGEGPAFACAMPTRLRADQVYNSLTQVLGVEGLSAGRLQRGAGMYGGGRDPGRAAFAQLFGYDPSTPQEDIVGSIPQALLLMNSPQLNSLIRGDGNTRLGQILRAQPDDVDALSEVYLLVLSRDPSDEELRINGDYIAQAGRRNEAFEDIFWSLLNSSEFLSRR